MDREEQRECLSDTEFKRLFGVKKETYEAMRLILEKEYAVLHQAEGCPPKLSVDDKLQIALQYLREYRTMEHIGFDWGVKKNTSSGSIKWVEDTLVKDGTFRLPGKRRHDRIYRGGCDGKHDRAA
ncbi:hypothetical protein FACS1894172_05190 [Spirochaetia bacterium]|nr:hypothetical protein FACS1894164_05750 [Spirochaetia bacterium]GHU31010.1 hypothetical protein FACS1894172_05190 [Spirochaetia bacterium]